MHARVEDVLRRNWKTENGAEGAAKQAQDSYVEGTVCRIGELNTQNVSFRMFLKTQWSLHRDHQKTQSPASRVF